MAIMPACLPEQLCWSGLFWQSGIGHCKALGSTSQRQRIRKTCRAWAIAPWCDPQIIARSFSERLNRSCAPEMETGRAWIGFRQERANVVVCGSPATESTRPRVSTTAAWQEWTDSMMPYRSNCTVILLAEKRLRLPRFISHCVRIVIIILRHKD